MFPTSLYIFHEFSTLRALKILSKCLLLVTPLVHIPFLFQAMGLPHDRRFP